jgi:hypothetical protein
MMKWLITQEYTRTLYLDGQRTAEVEAASREEALAEIEAGNVEWDWDDDSAADAEVAFDHPEIESLGE